MHSLSMIYELKIVLGSLRAHGQLIQTIEQDELGAWERRHDVTGTTGSFLPELLLMSEIELTGCS